MTPSLVDFILARCAALRAVVALHIPDLGRCTTCLKDTEFWPEDGGLSLTMHEWPCPTLRALAAVYAGHPDFRDEWRP